MSPLPKITLITTVKNGAAFIERCLQSVVNQGYVNLEYMVLDAVLASLCLWLRYPVRSIRNVCNWKMPQPYCARTSV